MHIQLTVSVPTYGFRRKYSSTATPSAAAEKKNCRIHEKDLVVIQKQETAKVGDIVVALIGDNENTLKRFGGLDEEGYAILEYQNEEVYPEKIIRVRDLIVQGVAKHVIRSL